MEKEIKQIIEIEREILAAYASEFGAGSSEYRGLKSFLLNAGRRKVETRGMVSQFESELYEKLPGAPIAPPLPPAPDKEGKKQTGGDSGQPLPLVPQQPENPALPPEQKEGVVDNTDNFDFFVDDVTNGMNVKGLSAKYGKDQLIKYADGLFLKVPVGATEKQIISIIMKHIKDATPNADSPNKNA